MRSPRLSTSVFLLRPRPAGRRATRASSSPDRRAEGARRPALLRAAAVADRPRAARLPAGRGGRSGHPRDGCVPDRPAPDRLPREGDTRRPGRLARGDAAVRVAVETAAQPAERRAGAGGGSRRRRGAHRVDADDAARARSRRRAGGGVPVVRRRRSLSRKAPAPLPERPSVLFVGVLERVKAFDTLVDAWRVVADACPRRRFGSSAAGASDRLRAARSASSADAWSGSTT